MKIMFGYILRFGSKGIIENVYDKALATLEGYYVYSHIENTIVLFLLFGVKGQSCYCIIITIKVIEITTKSRSRFSVFEQLVFSFLKFLHKLQPFHH